MSGLDPLKHLFGRQLGLDKDDNLIFQGTKIGFGRDGSASVIDLSSLALNAESFGVSSSSTAAVNTAALNAALALGGRISLYTPGTFQINAPLVYGSNTHLSLGPKTIIQQASGTNKMMLQSAAAVAFLAGGTAVTLTWSAGVSCSVGWTNHGLTAGQAVWLTGSTPTVFNGVFRIASVTDANTFVVYLRYLPSASNTGSAIGVVATQNVLIEGGTWDYNFGSNGSGTGRNRSALWFEGCADVVVRNVVAQNAFKYCFGTAATLNFVGENLAIPFNNSDGLKIYGPVFDCQIRGIKGQTGDDGVTIQAKEAAAFAVYQIADGGDAINVRISDVDIAPVNANVMSAGVYFSDNEVTDQITIDGVGGYVSGTGGTIKLQAGNAYTTGKFGRITLRNINGENGNANVLTGLCAGDLLVIENSRINLSALTTGSFLLTQSTSTISHVSLNNNDYYQTTWPTGVNAFPVIVGGVHDLVAIRGGYHKTGGSSSNSRLVEINSATIKQVQIDGVVTSSDTLCIVTSSATNTPLVTLTGCHVLGAGAVSVFASCTVVLGKGMRYTNASNAIVRFNATATVNLYSDGTTQLLSGSWFAAPSGTPTLNPHGWDISVDVGATGVTKTNGNYCNNNGSARGTLVQNRYVTCDGTSWYQLNVPANTF